MDEPPRPIPDEQIQDLLRQAHAAGEGRVREWGRVHLEAFRERMVEIVLWQRSEGRTRVFRGEHPDAILAEVNAKIAEAREDFRGKLERLLAWAAGGRGKGGGEDG